MRLFILSAIAAFCLPMALTHAQDAPPAERTLELHLHALSRGYMQPMRATTERVAAIKGLKNVEALGYGGDVLRYRVTTALGDDAVASALGLQKIGLSGSRLLLAADPKSPRATRAEARAVIMDIARAINARPKPKWSAPHKPLFTDADTTDKKLKLLGIDPEILNGVNYEAADYKIIEDGDRYNANYKIWAGKDWTPAPGIGGDEYGFARAVMRSEDGETVEGPAAKAEERWVGMLVSRSAWYESILWADAEGARMESTEGDRGETGSEGKLKVQEGAEWMQNVLKRAVAPRLRKPSPPIKELPAGRGYQLLGSLDAENLHRWAMPYTSECLEMTWTKRASDKHYIAKLTAHHAGHAFYLEAEVDADMILAAYKEKGDELSKIAEVELGDALKWIVGAEDGPEVFAERRSEARAAMDAMFAAFGKLPAEGRDAFPYGPLTEKVAADFGLAPGKHFKPENYTLVRQALSDIEISVGTPVSGGRWWLLGSPSDGKVIRSDR